MSGYYDHHPVVSLGRHFVLGGYFVAETRQIAYQLAALTGLGVTDLDRTIEHYAGKSIGELIETDGEDRYRRLESFHLTRLLAASPWAIISLGDGTLLDDGNSRRVLEAATLVVLDRDLANCYWQVRREAANSVGPWHPLFPGPVERFEQIRPFHEPRRPGFLRAHHRFDVTGQKRARVVERLMELIDGSPHP